jgi:hypothetical protein
MAFTNRSIVSASIIGGALTQDTISVGDGGVLLALNATWIGTELVDPTTAGTANEVFKPGDMMFTASTDGGQGAIGLAGDLFVVPQGSTYSYLHPEYNNIKSCGYLAGMMPNPANLNVYQGLVNVGGSVTLTTLADDAPYTSPALAGRHRLLYELEFLLFE